MNNNDIIIVSSIVMFIGLLGVLKFRNNLIRLFLSIQFIFLASIFNFSIKKIEETFLFSLFLSIFIGIQSAVFLIFVYKVFKEKNLLNHKEETEEN